jgi:NAD(P)-dependent dehydrogenase (short-subunit alcohol dehydrogenase family)
VAANEHARFGIRVNAVAPGFTLTAMVDHDEAMMPGFKQSQIEQTPMHRGADPVEIARAVVWLASDDASFVTGQTLAVDGGVTVGGWALAENPLNYMIRG